MDSLTQIILGASVGEAVAGRKIGNMALLWGAIAGTIPDLDVLASPWLDTVQELQFHRSVTHSFLFALVASPLLALLLRRIYPRSRASLQDWTFLFFLGFVTHAVLDSFTTWGTQLFWPFSQYGVAFYNIFVVDPFYTVPFLLLVVAAAFYKKDSKTHRRLNYTGLAISSCYLLFTFIVKQHVNRVFEQSLKQQKISYRSYISKPTPMNTFFWAVTVESGQGFYTGFYSIFDGSKDISFAFEPQQAALLTPYKNDNRVKQLLKITKGYYAVEEAERGVLVKDLRFGKFDDWRESGGQYVFVYSIIQSDQGADLQVEEINNRPKVDRAYLRDFIDRILGKGKK